MRFGLIAVISFVVVVAILALFEVGHSGLSNTLSMMAACVAFSLMALNQFLATRPPLIEGLFGGLDRIYELHKWIGVGALLLLGVHYFLTPNFAEGLKTYFIPAWNKLSGTVAFYTVFPLAGLIAFSLVKRIPRTNIAVPYGFWRWTHRLLGVLFILIAFHQFTVKKPVHPSSMLQLWLNIMSILGIASYLYTQLIARFRRRDFTVETIEKLPAATLITAKPSRRELRLAPGQFAFLSARKEGLREPHPFTVAGIEEDGRVRFAVKPLGDYTKALRETLAIGDKLRLEGGYGRFDYRRGGDRQIWLAGGIGITPFLAFAESLEPDTHQSIYFVYCIREDEESVGEDILKETERRVLNFSYRVHVSNREGRLDSKSLLAASPIPPKDVDMFFCGPPVLRASIVDGLKKLGSSPKRVFFEKFEFR